MKKIALAMACIAGSALALPTSLIHAQDQTSSQEQEYEGLFLGPYLGLNLNMHSPDFDVPSLGGTDGSINEGATEAGAALGVHLDYRISQLLGIGAKIGYNGSGSTLSGSGTRSTTGTTTWSSDMPVSLSYLDINPVASFYDIGTKHLYGLAGFNIGIPVTSEYSLTESHETLPSEQPFENADIPEASTLFGLTLGAGYQIPIADEAWFTPELQVTVPFTDVSGSENFSSWSNTQVRLTAALKFRIGGDEQDTLQNVDSDLEVKLDNIVYFDELGNEKPLRVIRVEDVQYSEMYPLVPYVFYDKNDASFNPTYQATGGTSETGEFNMNALKQDALEINKNTLNIIGSRMQKIENAMITITGTGDGTGESVAIARKRAEAARDYLVKNFEISKERILVEAKAKPAKPSTLAVPAGVAENRRVEITSNIPELLDPLMIEGDEQRLAAPRLIEFQPEVTTTIPVKQWSLTLSQGGTVLREFMRNGEARPRRWIVRPDELAGSDVPVEYRYVVVDTLGTRKEAFGTIPVEYLSSTRRKMEELSDKTIHKFSLILFDFDSEAVTGDNLRILEREIVPVVEYNSIVKVFGYADEIGEAGYNKQLANRRATAVADAIKKRTKAAKVEVHGVGEDLELFDNELPAGRFLCRTVQVVIETPAKK